MGLNLLFGLLLVVFLAVWAAWLYGISSDIRSLVVGGAIGVVSVAVAILAVNGQRVDDQEEAYGDQVIAFIDAVQAAQEERYEADGSYSDEVPEETVDLAAYDNGLLVNERDFDVTLTTERRSYSVAVDVEGQNFKLEVARTGGGVEQTRTCEGDPTTGCVDGTWSSAGAA